MKQSRNLSTGSLSNAVADAIRSDYAVQAVPKLVVDWNLNRYTTPTAMNTPDDQDEGFDVENFPIESIIEPLRPSKGIIKARVGEAVVSASYQHPTDPKFYIGDEKDKYKYWTSPYRTNGSGDFPNHTDGITSARPRVDYDVTLQSNKIVIRFENTWATPDDYSVHIKSTPAGSWSQIAGANPAMNETTGVLTLYYNGTAWVTTRPATLVSTDVASIELRVASLKAGVTAEGNTMSYYKRTSFPVTSFTTPTNTNGANSSLNVIAIEAHFEADLTDRLINAEDTFDMSETSQIYPIGTITTNTASITLSNEDGVFNKENTSSPYYGLLEPNAHVLLEYIYTINGVDHSVQQLSMFTNDWPSSDGTTSLELEDASKYLKEIKPRPVFYEGKAVTEIIWRLLDSVGFTDYEITFEDTVIEHEVPFFWTTGEETVWEVLDQLAQATQTAIYFDGNGKLQVRTRSAAFRDTDTADWNLLGQNDGSDLADILQDGLDVSNEFEANNVDVKYKATKWKVGTSGKPALSSVWEPEAENVVVRSSQLVRDIGTSSNFIFVDQKELKLWPFKSKVLIDGEIIQYDGKQFVYYTGPSGGPYIRETAIVKSNDDFKTYNRKTPAVYRKNNHYTGGLKIIEREVWNTEKRDHLVEVNGWSNKFVISGSYWGNPAGFKHQKAESIITINTPSQMNNVEDTMWVHRGVAGPSTGFKMYGTRIRFNKDKASPTQRAGIGFWQNSSEQGYYVEITLTNLLDGAKDRKTRGEVTIYSRKGTKWHVVAKGQPVAIAPGIWYDLDVSVSPGSQTHIKVWLNGSMLAEGTTTADTLQTETGKFSMYARGKTNVSFEYFYGRNNVADPPDDFGYYDLQYGGVRGNLFQREYVWEILTRRKKIKKKKWVKEKYRRSQFFFDEFGPYVHEVREFDVKFDPNPVQYSRLFSTNEWYSACLEYTSDAFGATFVIANTGRNHAILKGEDRLIYGGGSAAVNQVLNVLGRDLQISDEETVNKKNLAAIRARGQIDTELASDWIQTKAMANDIATWIASHWSAGIDEVTVDIFGNPLIEIGDVVDVDFDREHMTPATHKYFVTAASTSFEAGISTALTLRRVRTTAPSALT